MTRFFRPALRIEVRETAKGHPVGFSYKGKLAEVRQIYHQWRVREGWWREEAAREYFQLETTRFVCMIYRDMLTGHWYLQRLYD